MREQTLRLCKPCREMRRSFKNGEKDLELRFRQGWNMQRWCSTMKTLSIAPSSSNNSAPSHCYFQGALKQRQTSFVSSDASWGRTSKLVPRLGCRWHYIDVSFPKNFLETSLQGGTWPAHLGIGTGSFLLNLGGDFSGDFRYCVTATESTCTCYFFRTRHNFSTRWARESRCEVYTAS